MKNSEVGVAGMPSLGVEHWRSIFSYCPETGELTRLTRQSNCEPGSIAGCKKPNGYVYVSYKKRLYLAHRIVWMIHYGEIPSSPIDHINMVKSDNRLCNLRLASVTENNRNRPKQSNNRSGYKGVCLHKGTNKYQARVMTDGVNKSLGYFNTAEEANAACVAERKKHGEFARD